MNMRPLTYEERTLLANFASKLEERQRKQLLEDLKHASAEPRTPDGSRILFAISGYERPPYLGQHLFPIEGTMLDYDGNELSVLLYADENNRLLELEFIRWDSCDLLGPRLDTLKLQ
jgi:hypothetical protein